MRVLLVEPLGHMGGHFTAHTKHLALSLVDAGADVTLLTFDGLLGSPMGLDGKLKHISFMSKIGALAPVIRLLSNLVPSKFVRSQFDAIFSTICTFLLAYWQHRKAKYHVIHILDACMPDYTFPWFASISNNSCLVFTLFRIYREAKLQDLRARFRDALFKRQIAVFIQLWLSLLLGRRPATTLKSFMRRRGANRNRLAFICYTSTAKNSYPGIRFYTGITKMFLGAHLPDEHPLEKGEAREHLGLPPGEIVLLNFGCNHIFKNFETIFESLYDIPFNYRLVFAGRMEPDSKANLPWKLAEKYNLLKNVIIDDRYIHDEEVGYFFYASDAIILSYRKDFKASSGVLTDAAKYGIPIIASNLEDVGGTVEAYKLGLTFKAEDPSSLREAVLSFHALSDEDKDVIKKNLAYYAQTHSWQEVAKRHIEIYEGLIKGNQPEIPNTDYLGKSV